MEPSLVLVMSGCARGLEAQSAEDAVEHRAAEFLVAQRLVRERDVRSIPARRHAHDKARVRIVRPRRGIIRPVSSVLSFESMV